MLIAKRMEYANQALPGVDVRDQDGRLVASCFAHGEDGERILRGLLDAYPGEDVIVSYIRPRGGGPIEFRRDMPDPPWKPGPVAVMSHTLVPSRVMYQAAVDVELSEQADEGAGAWGRLRDKMTDIGNALARAFR